MCCHEVLFLARDDWLLTSQCARLDPELKATLKGAGDLGLRAPGTLWSLGSLASWQRSTPYTYIREVRETEADTGGGSGRCLLAGEINVHPLRVQSLYPDPLREEVTAEQGAGGCPGLCSSTRPCSERFRWCPGGSRGLVSLSSADVQVCRRPGPSSRDFTRYSIL